MDSRRKLRIVAGIVFAAASLFMALSLVSRNVSIWRIDQLSEGGTVTDSDLPNWCGSVGACFSSFVVHFFGTPAAFFALVLSVFWTYLLLSAREKPPDAYLKIFGSVLLVVAVSAISALAGNNVHFVSVVGQVTAHFATNYFGLTGAYLLLFLTAVLSLLLATDFMVIAPLGRFALSAGMLARVAFVKAFIVRPWSKKSDITSAPPARITRPEPEEKEPAPAVRSRRARDEEEKEASEEPAPPKPVRSWQAAATTVEEKTAPKKVPPGIPEKTSGEVEGYLFPTVSLLDDPSPLDNVSDDQYVQEKAKILEDTLAEFGVSVKVVGIETGPVITQYEIELAPGIKVNRVVSLSDDIAMALKAPSVRIVAPIAGRDSVGVEVPNTKKTIVRLKGLIREKPPEKIGILPVYLGRDAQGQPLVADLTELPHLLIAGATGSGKSVCINSIIVSILMKQRPDEVKFLLVDPKMVELSVYKDMPHLICPVVTDMKKASTILEWACMEMDGRYDYLAAANVRHISRYNKLGAAGLRERLMLPPDADIELPDRMPYIIIIIDELADLMMLSAKDVEMSITRLAQKSRSVGIHLVLATQRPSVDVITGLIKSNLPARLSFKVSSRIDSRTILDQNGADKLLGRGDMLYLPPATAKLIRAQGSYVSDDEIRAVVDFVKSHGRPDYHDGLVAWEAGGSAKAVSGGEGGSERDPLYDQAIQVVIDNQRGSVSLLQRRLEIGYSRAARLIDFMAEDGILGPYAGSQAREVLFTPEEWEDMRKQSSKRAR